MTADGSLIAVGGDAELVVKKGSVEVLTTPLRADGRMNAAGGVGGRWRPVADLRERRSGAGCCLLPDGRLVVCGGRGVG
eukprot:SAG22_NODE_13056_length_420_cov_1.112150_1_plen_78_part_10